MCMVAQIYSILWRRNRTFFNQCSLLCLLFTGLREPRPVFYSLEVWLWKALWENG